ncbi:DUF2180 family protein [Streptomyces sp. NPDC052015]|uniref:DUF2180 family protein n=1 Tax=Streptomyces sp. NPDC052015 TaxID=3154755 RepID=UPI00343B01F3
MHCYDCSQEGHNEATGIGCCTRCGLFTCADHSLIMRSPVQRPIGVIPMTSALPARRLVCGACRTAEAA